MACAFMAWWERNQSIASICFLKFQKQIFVFSGDHYVLSMDGLGIVVPFSFLGGESPGKKGASFYTCSASEAAVLGSVCLAACWYYLLSFTRSPATWQPEGWGLFSCAEASPADPLLCRLSAVCIAAHLPWTISSCLFPPAFYHRSWGMWSPLIAAGPLKAVCTRLSWYTEFSSCHFFWNISGL